MARIYERNGYWHIAYGVNGRDVRKACKTKDRKVAMQMKKAIELKLASAHFLQILKKDCDFHLSGKDTNIKTDWVLSRWHRLNSKEKQAIIFTLYEGKCAYCSVDVRLPTRREKITPDRATVDHKIPFIAGGSDALDNLILACNKCNQMKADKDESEFLNEIALVNIEKISG